MNLKLEAVKVGYPVAVIRPNEHPVPQPTLAVNVPITFPDNSIFSLSLVLGRGIYFRNVETGAFIIQPPSWSRSAFQLQQDLSREFGLPIPTLEQPNLGVPKLVGRTKKGAFVRDLSLETTKEHQPYQSASQLVAEALNQADKLRIRNIATTLLAARKPFDEESSYLDFSYSLQATLSGIDQYAQESCKKARTRSLSVLLDTPPSHTNAILFKQALLEIISD